MSRKITAIYENGVLRPLSPLELPEHSQVEITVQQVDTIMNNSTHRDQVRHALAGAGVSLPVPDDVFRNTTPLTEERRKELAHLFSTDQLLSKLISEDREGR